VEHQAQLEWERRMGRPAAAAAFVAAAFVVAYQIVLQAVALSSRPDNKAELLRAVSEKSTAFIASAVLQSLSLLALGFVLWFLFRITQYRRPELPSWSIYLVYLGPVLLAVAGVLVAIDQVSIANHFTDSGPETVGRAKNLLDDRSVVGVGLGSAGTLALAFSLVLVSLNAMRAGVLSRFLGVIGMITGALYVLPIFGGPYIVQIFWLGAVGAVFLGYWPGGRGPAWESGEADPWPTAADRRQALAPAGEAGGPEGAEPDAEEPDAPHPVSKKRKRKRRR
jgi:uncharacterized protein DUF4386